MRISRLVTGALALLTACAAPDYTPVRDWASTASGAADFPAIVAAAPPTADAAAILAMQDALAVYLSALGVLAMDGVLPYREDPLAEQAARTAPVDPTGASAITALGGFLRRATHEEQRAPQLRGVIVTGDPAVQALVASLAAAVDRQAMAEAPAPEGSPVGSPEQTDRALARAQYAQVLRQIGEGSALLVERAPTITRPEAVQRIRAAEDQLRRAARTLPRPVIRPLVDGTPAG